MLDQVVGRVHHLFAKLDYMGHVAPSRKVPLLDLDPLAPRLVSLKLVAFALIELLLQVIDEVDEQDTAQLLCRDPLLQRDCQGVPRDHVQLFESLLFGVQTRVRQEQGVQLTAHVVDCPAVLVLLVDVLLVGQ